MAFVCDLLDKNGEICGNSFSTLKYYRQHIRKTHEGKFEVVCCELIDGQPCNTICKHPSNLQVHIEKRHSPKKCDECDLDFPDSYAYDKHFYQTHQKIFHCKKQGCGAVLYSVEDFEAHVCTPDEVKIKCSFTGPCISTFLSVDTYKAHIRHYHRINDKEGINVHMRGIKRDASGKFKCTFNGPCQARFIEKRGYARHLTSQHNIREKEHQRPYLENVTRLEAVDEPKPKPSPVNEPKPSTSKKALHSSSNEKIYVEPATTSFKFEAPFYLGESMAERGIWTFGRFQRKYNFEHKIPAVVYQLLDSEYVRHPNIERPHQSFLNDLMLDSDEVPKNADYTHSGYHRGHLASKRNHLAHFWTWRDTHYYSNIAAMLPKFNMGIWEASEDRERYFTRTVNKVHSYSGPILVDHNGEKVKTKGNLTIASNFFKILVGEIDGKFEIESYVFPHKEFEEYDITDHYSSVKEINSLTGLDLLKGLNFNNVVRINGNFV